MSKKNYYRIDANKGNKLDYISFQKDADGMVHIHMGYEERS